MSDSDTDTLRAAEATAESAVDAGQGELPAAAEEREAAMSEAGDESELQAGAAAEPAALTAAESDAEPTHARHGWAARLPALLPLRIPPSPRTLRLLATLGAIVVLVALLPTLLNASHNPVNATRARATATPQPPTPIPSPTAIPGYRPLVDSSDGFVIQRPLAWSCSPSHPGVDCIDSPDAQTYRFQVQLPGDWTGADATSSNGGSAWVDYALSAFSDVPGRTFERVPVTGAPGSIGGETWQSGAAIIGIEQPGASDGSGGASAASTTPTPTEVRIRVQVYATVHDGTPFIIALYAADDTFSTGSNLYFQPMLQSFAFLPNSDDR